MITIIFSDEPTDPMYWDMRSYEEQDMEADHEEIIDDDFNFFEYQ